MREENDLVGYKILVGESRTEIRVCYDERVFNSTNWTPDPIVTTVPMLYVQILVTAFLSTIIFILLKPLNQSRLVATIIAGICIGPTFLANFPAFPVTFFPFDSDFVLEFSMTIGIVYYMFQLGLDMNLTPMLKIGKRTTTIAILGMILPMVVGFAAYFLVIPPLQPGESVIPKLKSAFVWAIALNATNLPDLTRVLAELKLLRTDIGRTAVASSFINDIATWFFLAVLISISRPGYVIRMCISTLILILFCTFLARPMLSWLISRTSNEQNYKEIHVQFILYGVLVWAFITDALGLGSFVGAFLFGFSLPSGSLATLVSERIEKIASWVMVPLYCTVNGLKTTIWVMIPRERSVKHVLLFIAVSWLAKVVSTFLVSSKSKRRSPQEVFTLGVLMNSKGILALIVVNIGRELYLVDIEASTVMVVTILLMMMSVPPVVRYTYKPQKRMMRHKMRTIMSTGSESTFRILTCMHTKNHVQGITSLLQMSNATSMSKIYAIGVNLVELTDLTTSAAMLIVHDSYMSKSSNQRNAKTKVDPIIEAMEEFGRANNPLILVECLTAVSRYTTMHIDICSIAEDKRAALIIIPFHEQASSKDEGEDGIDSHSIRNMNQQVLSNAPCTVGLLVDHGLGKPNSGVTYMIVFYIGGADDREALSYAWRMVCRPNIHLTVVRFIEAATAPEPTPLDDDADDGQGILNLLEDNARQKELDDEFIDKFKRKAINNQSLSFSEEVVNSGDETLAVIRNVMEANTYHLCIIGKGDRRISAVESGLADLVEFQELGAIGDAIVTSNFSSSASVLVIQHYRGIQRDEFVL